MPPALSLPSTTWLQTEREGNLQEIYVLGNLERTRGRNKMERFEAVSGTTSRDLHARRSFLLNLFKGSGGEKFP